MKSILLVCIYLINGLFFRMKLVSPSGLFYFLGRHIIEFLFAWTENRLYVIEARTVVQKKFA